MELSTNILKSSNNFLQHKPHNVPESVPLECTVPDLVLAFHITADVRVL